MLLHSLEFARLNLDMDSNLLHPAIKYPDKMAVPACPDFSADIFRRYRIIRLLNLNMTVTMN